MKSLIALGMIWLGIGPFADYVGAQVPREPLPTVYVHGGGGMAFSWFTSSDIEALFDEEFGIESLGFPFSWNLNAGIRNLLQIEFRRGDGAHDVIKNGLVGGGEFGTIATIKMDYDFEDKVLKLNPFFWLKSGTKSGVNMAYFVILGRGKVSYKDESGDGFEGNSSIWGVEVALIRRFVTAGASIKKYSVDFNQGSIFGIPFAANFGGSQLQFQVNMAVGLGI